MAKTPASWEYPSFNNTFKFPFRIQKKKPAILFPQLYIHTAPMEYSHSFLAGCEHGIHIQAQKLRVPDMVYEIGLQIAPDSY